MGGSATAPVSAGTGFWLSKAGGRPRKGRARRFREARELKQGFDDGLFAEGKRTLADVDLDDKVAQAPARRDADPQPPRAGLCLSGPGI